MNTNAFFLVLALCSAGPSAAQTAPTDSVRVGDRLLLKVEGGGHTFPHPFHRFPRFIGPTNADLDAAAEIWRFFTDKRLGSPGTSG